MGFNSFLILSPAYLSFGYGRKYPLSVRIQNVLFFGHAPIKWAEREEYVERIKTH